jgi:hypothetical protein
LHDVDVDPGLRIAADRLGVRLAPYRSESSGVPVCSAVVRPERGEPFDLVDVDAFGANEDLVRDRLDALVVLVYPSSDDVDAVRAGERERASKAVELGNRRLAAGQDAEVDDDRAVGLGERCRDAHSSSITGLERMQTGVRPP